MPTYPSFSIRSQPTDSTCGPTCLHAVYQYWNDTISLEQVIGEIGQMTNGGTLAVQLACHALKRGYQATIDTWNVQLFDPTWFNSPHIDLREKLAKQLNLKLAQSFRGTVERERIAVATACYMEFIELGGTLQMPDPSMDLMAERLGDGEPVLCGLSSTFLYRECREMTKEDGAELATSDSNDLAGDPAGHFVVLYGIERTGNKIWIADPLTTNPLGEEHLYYASFEKVLAALFLGIVTYDANLLTIRPRRSQATTPLDRT